MSRLTSRHDSPRHAWTLAREFVALLAILVIWRWSVLASPPYYDQAIGVWREADFLAHSGFDYRRLWFHEPYGRAGGANSYGTSVLPTLLAGLQRVLPTSAAIVAYRLVSLACAAAMGVLLADLLRRRVGRLTACLAVVALFTLPMVWAQLDMVGLDLQMTAAVVATVWAISRRRAGLAIALAALAFLFKATGMIVTVALVGVFALQALQRFGAGRSARRQVVLLAVATLLLVAELAAHFQLGVGRDLATFYFSGGFWSEYARLCPDLLAAIVVVGGVLCVWFALRIARFSQRYPAASPWAVVARAVGQIVRASPGETLAALTALGTLLAVALVIRVYIVRYLLVVAPLVTLLLVSVAAGWFHGNAMRRRALALAVALLIAVNLTNAKGRWFPEIAESPRLGVALERSLEYLPDHQSNVAAMRFLDALEDDAPVAAPFPFVQFLAVPSEGYVARARRGYSCQPWAGEYFGDLAALLRDAPARLLLVSVDNSNQRIGDFGIPTKFSTELAEVLYADEQASPLRIVRLTLPDDWDPARRALWYAEHLVFDRSLVDEKSSLLAGRADLLAAAGRSVEARRVLELAAGAELDDTLLRRKLAELQLRQGDAAGAISTCEQVLRAIAGDPNADLNQQARRETLRTLALAQATTGAAPDAIATLQRAEALGPRDPATSGQLAATLASAGQPEAALAQYQRALSLDPSWAIGHNNLGGLLESRGEAAAALQEYETAAALDGRLFEAAAQAAMLCERLGRRDAARGWYQRALALQPGWADGQQRLRRLTP